MKKGTIIAFISAILSVVGSLGAFSVKLDYERSLQSKQFKLAQASHQQQLGELARHLTITFFKSCENK